MKTTSRRERAGNAAVGKVQITPKASLSFARIPDNHASALPSEEGTAITETLYSTASWRTAPDAVAEFAETYTADVCILGLGHAGASCMAQIADSGFSVIGVEKQSYDEFKTVGHEFGTINSKLAEELGGSTGHDPAEFFNNWMLNCANAANPSLISKYTNHGGETMDWWYSKADEGTKAHLIFEGANEERPHIVTELGAFKFFCCSVGFDDASSVKNTADALTGDSRVLWNHTAYDLIKDEDGNVTGAVVQNVETGEYIRINAKAVVLATGGFGANEEMCDDLLTDMKEALQHNDKYRLMTKMGFDHDGTGIRLGYLAGGHIEPNPATLDGRASWQTAYPALVPMLAHPQGIHLDYTGRRFYNEYWGPIELRSRPLMYRNRDVFYAVYDDNLTEYMQYVPASHGTTNPSAAILGNVRRIMNAAYALKGTGYYDEKSQSTWYAGDTIEELLECIGMDEKVKNNALRSIREWNQICSAGSDTQFARDSKFLFPIEKGPFYINVNENNLMMGNFLVTLGGLIVDGDQRVLGKDWMPVKGLFATGNTTGGRFGWDYFSPAYGVSVGIATALGRECGKSIVEYLEDKLV